MNAFLSVVALASLLVPSAPASGQGALRRVEAARSVQAAERGWLGITVEEDTGKSRIVIVEVVPASPAQKGGLKTGDAILEVQGEKVPSFDSFLSRMSKVVVGQKMKFLVARGDKKEDVTVVLGKRPGAKKAAPKKAEESTRTGREQAAPAKRRGYLGVEIEEEGKRVAVSRVVQGSAADRAGVKVGDRIVAIDGKKLEGFDDLVKRIRAAGAGSKMGIQVLRRGEGGSWDRVTMNAELGAAMPAPRDSTERVAAKEMPARPAKKVSKKTVERTAKKTVKKTGTQSAKRRVRAPKVTWHTDYEKAVAMSKKSGRPLVVDFHATWCKPCKMLAESFEARGLQGLLRQAVLVKVDTDKHGKLADKFGVHGIPHVVVMTSNGQTVGTFTGYLNAEQLQQRLGGYLAKAGVRPGATQPQAMRVRRPAAKERGAKDVAKATRATGMTVTPEMVEQFKKEMVQVARREAQRIVRQELRRYSQQMRKQMTEMREMLRRMAGDGRPGGREGAGEVERMQKMMQEMLQMQKRMLERMEGGRRK